jgi:predicted AAA+ superfamily ATPase
MEREAMTELVAWRSRPRRKPLLIRGARQVGKTWLAKQFGALHFRQCVYVNFDQDSGPLHSVFAGQLRPAQIVRALAALYDVTIDPDDTLLIFDEIQEEPRALESLKYFAEDASQYAVVAAGSHLGVTLHPDTSFPVGKVDFLHLHPLTFAEFVLASAGQGLYDELKSGDWALLGALHPRMVDLLREYLVVGGMPEVVQGYLDDPSPLARRATQRDILEFYRSDFGKHAPATQLARIWQVWDSIPVHLGKPNQKLIWGAVREGGRAKDFELAVQWLCATGVATKVPRLSKPGLPLSAYAEDDVFKLFGLDVGLLGAQAGLDPATLLLGDAAFTEFRGTLAEQYVLQQVVAHTPTASASPAYYWTGKSAEVDFVVQLNGDAVPLEVKSAEHVRSLSLRSYLDRYNPAHAYRLSLAPYREQDGFINVPLYAIDTLFS